MAESQANRIVKVTTPLDDDVLLLNAMAGHEELGRLFEYELDLTSKDHEIDANEILGKPMTVELEMADGGVRYFHGFTSHFYFRGMEDEYSHFTAILRPWLWFLTRTADCRIFQELSVPDIIKQVFRDFGFSDFEEYLSQDYRVWNYCVQYRETAFNFVSRLMEQEGIYYYFKHEDNRHILVLADSISAHETVPDYDEIPFFPPGNIHRREREHIFAWSSGMTIQPGNYVLNEYNFVTPKANLLSNRQISREHSAADYEIYDYPGEYVAGDEGQNYARTRIEELQAEHLKYNGSANTRGLATGCLFQLSEYPRSDQNIEYLVTGTQFDINSNQFSSGSDTEEVDFNCSFNCISSKEVFRSGRTTPKPVVQGPQTATVVGKAGDEIWTDEHARVKLQFHWDRYGQSDENSSCWVRVSQLWAGANWGGIHIPRIGQEVIVDFLEGDPDRPMVTGRVYNGDNKPPYDLPDNATQSGIKSRSSKGGSGANFNEIRMEDKKGEEQLYVHAEKNQDNIVENDETTSVGNNRTETVGNDEKIDIGNNRTESVGNNEDITIVNNRTEKVGVNETINIGSNRSVVIGSNKSETITINKAETIGAAKELTIGGMYQVTVGGVMNESVAGAKTQEVGAVKATMVGGDVNESYGSNQATEVSDDKTITVGKTLKIDVADEITIATGEASITMKKDGTINIAGKDITLKGSGDITVKSSGDIKVSADKDITMKGTKILQN